MAKIRIKLPEIRFRPETVEVPPTRIEQVKQALQAQQERVYEALGKRNQEVVEQAERAAKGSRLDQVRHAVQGVVAQRINAAGGASTRPNPEAEQAEIARGVSRVDQIRQALQEQQGRVAERIARRGQETAQQEIVKELEPTSSGAGRRLLGILGLLGVGAAVGGAIGVITSPTTGKAARTQLAQQGGKLARTASDQAARTAKTVSEQARQRAATVRTQIAQSREQAVDPETITARVQTELGEDDTLRALPRINVNTEPGGVVYLRGALPSEVDRQRAEEIARRQRGVHEVINEIHAGGDHAVRPSAAPSDAVVSIRAGAIAPELRLRLR